MSAEAAWETVIVGGGLAGAATACHLAQAGRQVLLIENQRRAHHKVCGEFLSMEAQHDLRALGIEPLRFDAARISAIRLFDGARVARARLPFQGLGLSRYILDEQLLARAAACGVAIRRGCKITGVEPDGARWRLEARNGDCMGAHTVFLATGKHELRDQKRPPGRHNDFVGFKMHFSVSRAKLRDLQNHIDIVLFDGGYAGLQLVEGGKANLCLLIEKRRLAELDKDWDALLDYLKQSPHLKEFLLHATPQWERPLAIASLPYGYIYTGDDERTRGLYRLGDQFAVTPSFSGDGMSIALHTGKLAARAFLRAQGQAARFHSQARGDVRPQIKAAMRLANTMNSPAARRLGFAACRAFPPLIAHMVRRTRLRASMIDENEPEDTARK